MIRLAIAVLALTLFVVFVECWPASKEHGLLLERLKRSPHYCEPEYSERGTPVPPVPPAPPMPIYPPSFWPRHHHDHHRYHDFEYIPNFDQFKNYQDNNPSCETCKEKGTNTAVSNAESESGNAVAIAISRSKPN